MSKFRALVVASLLLSAAASKAQAQQPQRPAPIPSIEDRTNAMRKIDGYFPLYWDEQTGSLFVEIPRLDTDFLMSTGLSAGLGSNDIGLDRGQGGAGRIVRFERVGPRVMMTQANQTFRSSGASVLERKGRRGLVREIDPVGIRDSCRVGWARARGLLEAARGRATFYAVDVLQAAASFEHGKAVAMFSVDRLFIDGSGPGNLVDISPDGKQFVTLLLPPRSDSELEQSRVTIVLNWFADLNERVPR